MRDEPPVENKLTEPRRSDDQKRADEALDRLARRPLDALPGDPDDPMICRGLD